MGTKVYKLLSLYLGLALVLFSTQYVSSADNEKEQFAPFDEKVPPGKVLKKGYWRELFNGKNLKGWEQINGTATYAAKDSTILGTTKKGSPNSFLCTVQKYRDFELSFEVKVDSRLNSGVQIRSNSYPDYRNHRVHGYQVEISTNGNAGRIYDEARRGCWLDEQNEDNPARKAFLLDQWNKYHVQCIGDTIRTWVNNVPVAEITDTATPEGFIGLQVHSFKGDTPAQVQWRNIKIREITVPEKDKLKVVVVTGGHKFDHDTFFAVFQGHKDIGYVEAFQKDHSELFEDINGWDYDVIVLYNMTQQISQKRRDNFLKLLNQGVGLLALHHSMDAYQEWPEFRNIIGTKYFLKPTVQDGVEYQKSSYKHDLDLQIKIKDKYHPITQGMNDFDHHDETYKNCWFAPDNYVLLTCDDPTSDKTVGWVREYGGARVCTIQLGHGPKSYANPNYKRLLTQAIRWCGKKKTYSMEIPRPGEISLFDGKNLGYWNRTDFYDPGRVYVKDGTIQMETGNYMTGINWRGPVVRMNYEISLDAMKTKGEDFFCGLTFPVGENPCTFVVGGWGGQVVGLSNINYEDAANNETCQIKSFEKGRWYHIRVRVTPTKIETWIDKEKMVDIETANRHIDIRIEVEESRPLGIANWQTGSALKNIKLKTF